MHYEGKEPIIRMNNIVKSFPGVKALDKMMVDLFEGEIHCIVGENGAGKSTLMKVLSGAYTPDEGEIIVDGKVHTYMTSRLSKELGINIIYQENILVPWMNVVENTFVGQEIGPKGFVSFKAEYEKTKELCLLLGITLDLKQTIHSMSVAQQQFVKLVKALSTNPRVLIMDEPTSMFNVEDAGRVLKLVQEIAKSGVGIIYISHFLKEVRQIADRITVIRDGAPVNTYENHGRDIDLDIIVSDMVGRPASSFYIKDIHPIGEKVFEVIDLQLESHSPKLNFSVNKGEILGVAGMVGSGRTEIANAIFGSQKRYGGKVLFRGAELKNGMPISSIQHRVAYITEDRQRLGLMLDAPIVENLATVGMQTKIKGAFINIKSLIPEFKQIIESLKIKISNPMQPVSTLSGGNQQKVVLGKWLYADFDFFIFDEPTRGIDVNAKFEFYKLITGLAGEGKSIILISSDMPELISLSDRIIVIHKGDISATLSGEQITENAIIRHALEVENDDSKQQADRFRG